MFTITDTQCLRKHVIVTPGIPVQLTDTLCLQERVTETPTIQETVRPSSVAF